MKEDHTLSMSKPLEICVDDALNSLKKFLSVPLIEKTRKILYSKIKEDSENTIRKELCFLHILEQLGENQLTELSLKGSKSGPEISNYGIELLCEILKNNTSLTKLDLSDNYLDYAMPGKERMFATLNIAGMLKKNIALEYLNLSNNYIHETAALCKALGKNTTLTELDLSGNKLRAVEPELDPMQSKEVYPFTLFSELLEINITLTKLDLSENVSYFPTFQEYKNEKLFHLKESSMHGVAQFFLADSFMKNRQQLISNTKKQDELDKLDSEALEKISNLLKSNRESELLDALGWLSKKESSDELKCKINDLLLRIILLHLPVHSVMALRRLYATGNEFLSKIDPELEQLILESPENYLFDSKNIEMAKQKNVESTSNILKEIRIEKNNTYQKDSNQTSQIVRLINLPKSTVSIKRVYPFFNHQLLHEKCSKKAKYEIERLENLVQKFQF